MSQKIKNLTYIYIYNYAKSKRTQMLAEGLGLWQKGCGRRAVAKGLRQKGCGKRARAVAIGPGLRQ